MTKSTRLALPALLTMFTLGSTPALAQSQDFPFTCTIDLAQLSATAASNIPQHHRGRSFITPGEKKCTFSATPTVQIRCTTVVGNWPNPINVTTSDFEELCQYYSDECGFEGRLFAHNQQFKIRRLDSNTAELDLFCLSNAPPPG